MFRHGKAKELGCWAHTRRGSLEAKNTDAKRAGQVLAAIKRLYAIEDRAKAVAEESQRPLPDVRLELRQREAAPIIATLGEWLRTQQQQVLPKSPIAQAIGYAINQWAALLRYLDDSRLDIDNNRAEGMLRPVAVGRKNHLFVFNEVTGKSATVLMSLVATCRAIGVDARLYLNDVLHEMRRSSTPDVASLTPHAWKAREDQEARRSVYRAASTQAVAEAVLAVMRK